jgi:fluoride ion exporter CrcB/FEX
MSKIILILLAGAVGGILRGILGIAKELVTKKDVKINWTWFFASVFIAAILGMVTASFFLDDTRLALVGGYAGTDFMEGLMSLLLKNKFSNLGKEPEVKSKFGELLEKDK